MQSIAILAQLLVQIANNAQIALTVACVPQVTPLRIVEHVRLATMLHPFLLWSVRHALQWGHNVRSVRAAQHAPSAPLAMQV